MHKLSDYAGKKVILYFYPKDNTPGCTKQACGFSERYPQFTEKGAVILGVSKDSVASHKRFEEKYGLAFTLLADPERKVIEAYDVWKEKKNYGKVSMGCAPCTGSCGWCPPPAHRAGRRCQIPGHGKNLMVSMLISSSGLEGAL